MGMHPRIGRSFVATGNGALTCKHRDTERKTVMNWTRTVITKWVLVMLGTVLSLECLGSTKPNAYIWHIWSAVWIYQSQHGKFPYSLDEITQPGYGLKKENLIDRWGEPIGLAHDEDDFVLISSGPDRKLGTADDIVWGSDPLYVACWKEKHGLPVDTNALQRVASEQALSGVTARTGDTKWEASKLEMEKALQVIQEQQRERKAFMRTVKIGGSLILLGILGGIAIAWRYIRKRRKLKTGN